MQINNQAINNQTKTHDKPLELRQGEIYRATVKEKGSNNEAVLQIRGREVLVKFDGKAPSQERVTVQISGQSSDQLVQVRAISEAPKTTTRTSQTEAANINQALRSLGVSNPSQELRQAAQMILDKGIPLNRESVQDLRTFLEKEKGTVEQRLNTVQAVANKRLDVTATHLRSVHEALNGRPLNEVITSIAREIDSKFEPRREQSSMERTENRVQAERTPSSSRAESRPQLEQRLTDVRPQTEPRTVENRPTQERVVQERPVSEQVRQVRDQVHREPNVQRSIEQVRSEVVNNPRVDREVARQVERAVDEARALQQSGREVAARERLTQALQTAEREITRTEARTQPEPRVVENRPQTEPRTVENRPTQERVVQERPVSEQVRQVRDQVHREPNVQRSIEQVRNEVVNNSRVDREVARQVERAVDEARALQQSGREVAARNQLVQSLDKAERLLNNSQPNTQVLKASTNVADEKIPPTEVLKKMQSTVQKEGDFQKATSQLNTQIEKAPFEQPTKDLLTKSLKEATKLQEQGRELAARQQLMQSFTSVESQVAKLDQATQPEAQQYTMNEAFQTQQLNSKDLIVQTITEKLAKAQADFKSLQRELTRNLDNIQRLTEAFKSQASKQVKPLLETTIKKLDNAILKSEMMLLTDMKTEKRLMQASSQLAEAKKLLTKGNYQEANKIVQEVKNLVEKLEFKPSDTKVKHFISKEEQNLQNRPASQQVLQQFDEMTRRAASTQDLSARQAFELVRGLGLNRDTEIAQMLASGRQVEGESNQNMKNALLQLMKMEEEQGRVSQQTSQALANITGQQLLSKSDTNSNLQSMFFSLPLLLEDEVRNLQVFVNSRNEGQQVDWENCNLYFLIETKKLGEVGILVTATDRNLSLTIKNDQPLFKERIEPLAELCKEKLVDVGYNIASINFTKLNAVRKKPESDDAQTQQEQEKLTPTFTEKGFDFKI